MLSVIRTRLLGTNQAQRGVPENCKFLGKRRYGEKSATARKGGRRKATVSTRFGTKRPWVRKFRRIAKSDERENTYSKSTQNVTVLNLKKDKSKYE